MARIGFIAIGNRDYITEAAESITACAVEALRGLGQEIIYSEKIAVCPKSAREAALNLLHHNVDGVILFLSTWMESPVAMAALREVDHLPFALWGVNMFTNERGERDSTGSFVAYVMFQGSLKRMGYHFAAIMGLGSDRAAVEKTARFCLAAEAFQRLKRSTIGLVGYSALGIYPGTFDHVLLRKKIGPEVDQFDTYTLINALNSFSEEDCPPVLDYLHKTAKIKQNVTQEQLLTVSKMYLALKKLCENRGLDAINVKCQYELSQEYGMTACVPLSILAENGIVASCEGDIPNTVSMMVLQYLSGEVTAYADIVNIGGDNVVTLSPCGFIPFSMGSGEKVIGGFLPGFGFKGIQNSFSYKSGRVTLLRLVEDVGDYHFICWVADGSTAELRQGYMPAMEIPYDGDVDRFLGNLSGQHLALCYGDYSREVEMLATLLNIGFVRL